MRRLPALVALLLHLLLRVSAILHPADFLALQAVRAALSDLPGSRFFSAWDFSGDPCDFPGVLCASDRVVSLSLGDPRAGAPGLSGRLHPALGRLSALTDLSLVPGRVSGPLPAAFALLSDLRFLALSRNLFSGAIPPGLSALRRLRTLDLSSNLLSGELPASLAALPELAVLILSHNRLSGALPPLSPAASLDRLDLSHNSLSGPFPALPGALRYLSLASNLLSGALPASLPRLAHLDLSSNHLSGPIPPAIFELPLTTLQLQRNALSGPVDPSAEIAIGTVDLSYNMLWGAVSPRFAGVRRLYLNSNRFWGDLPAELARSVAGGTMELLYVQHNFLRAAPGFAAARGLPRGSAVCMEYNCMVVPVVDACPTSSGRAKSRPTDQCRGWMQP